MDWNNLRFFLSVVRQGSVMSAAKELGVTHATVIRRIEKLEKELDSKLFNRHHNGYRLTAIGESTYQNAVKVEDSVHELTRTAKEGSSLSGELTISVPDAGVLNLAPFMKNFIHCYKDIRLKILASMEVSNLNNLEVDIALRMNRSPDELLIGKLLGHITFNAYASHTYLQQFNERPSPAIYDWVFWVDESRKKYRKHIDLVTTSDVPFTTVYQSPDPSQVLNAIKSGMGLGFLADSIAQEYEHLEKVTFTNQQEISFSIPLWLLYHRDRKNDQKIQAFRELMTQIF